MRGGCGRPFARLRVLPSGGVTQRKPWEGSGRGQASSHRADVSETTCCFFKDLGPFVFPFTFPLSFVITAGGVLGRTHWSTAQRIPLQAGARQESSTIAGRSVPNSGSRSVRGWVPPSGPRSGLGFSLRARVCVSGFGPHCPWDGHSARPGEQPQRPRQVRGQGRVPVTLYFQTPSLSFI